ncbi:MAG: cation/multidrug efflux pump [Woeseiaceae bacterium]|nr:cation/multidrug efflux pump [Woeseiaceae bacterium]NIP21425.1 cation/multidrug efflux pump [Woeseiaceae bacterium]NIS90350.1 cation/multidrug efflux pump [Woeseiaceae bacterium]
MNVFIAASAILTLIAILYLGATVRHLGRRHFLRAGGSAATCVATGALGTAGILLFISYLGYERLTDEQLVGVIEFTRASPQEYTARLMVDGELDRLLILRGDEWQLDARVVTWKPPATILGFEPVYQLERLSGRYSSVDRELSQPRTVHDLAEERPLDLWSFARNFPKLTPGVDAYYGTATYVPMADGARFRVTLSRDALIARPINDEAREAVGDWGQDDDVR